MQTRKLRSLHRTAAKTCRISFRREFEYLSEFRIHISCSRRESWLSGVFFKPIPRTNILTDVAAVQPTSQIHFSGQLRRTQFDRRVRNALVRIDYVRLSNRMGGAGVDAKRTRTAVVFNAIGIVIKFEIQNQLADKYPGAMLRSYDVRVFTEPAQSCAHRPGLVHHRLNINTNLSFRLWILLADPRKQRREFCLHDIVIVVSPGIAGDFAGCRGLLMLVRCKVVKCYNYD